MRTCANSVARFFFVYFWEGADGNVTASKPIYTASRHHCSRVLGMCLADFPHSRPRIAAGRHKHNGRRVCSRTGGVPRRVCFAEPVPAERGSEPVAAPLSCPLQLALALLRVVRQRGFLLLLLASWKRRDQCFSRHPFTTCGTDANNRHKSGGRQQAVDRCQWSYSTLTARSTQRSVLVIGDKLHIRRFQVGWAAAGSRPRFVDYCG